MKEQQAAADGVPADGETVLSRPFIIAAKLLLSLQWKWRARTPLPPSLLVLLLKNPPRRLAVHQPQATLRYAKIDDLSCR